MNDIPNDLEKAKLQDQINAMSKLYRENNEREKRGEPLVMP